MMTRLVEMSVDDNDLFVLYIMLINVSALCSSYTKNHFTDIFVYLLDN